MPLWQQHACGVSPLPKPQGRPCRRQAAAAAICRPPSRPPATTCPRGGGRAGTPVGRCAQQSGDSDRRRRGCGWRWRSRGGGGGGAQRRQRPRCPGGWVTVTWRRSAPTVSTSASAPPRAPAETGGGEQGQTRGRDQGSLSCFRAWCRRRRRGGSGGGGGGHRRDPVSVRAAAERWQRKARRTDDGGCCSFPPSASAACISLQYPLT
ncbi:hypothetical protein BU14_0329s0014 [Porphyra umbilicalis]|uniref:Uncharacterized protein n=1 Tax=Porphyra umbilicalis TaxID=2786 RepID=A0A1X6NZ07_PORUM|nr:hypothetical protein BU14_0329s0014 [Porphyra umbilicalis]|eukprot:OSX73746.1 hypothetical protein BU14_0329s0014 [Porphyra umbilicalis]